MSSFSFSAPGGKTFELKVPQGVTEQQARAIFEQQLNTGSLTGFKVGDALSAVTQAADGLPAAKALLAQTAGGLSGALGGAVNLNTIAASLGGGALAAAQQVGSSLTGSLAGAASLVTGASAAVNGAVSGLTSQLGTAVSGAAAGLSGAASGLLGGGAAALTSAAASLSGSLPSALTSAANQLTQALGTSAEGVVAAVTKNIPVSAVLNTPLTGAAAQIGSVASTAVATMTKAISGIPTAAINTADFVKQIPSVAGLASLSAADVTGTLAAASKMVGQLPSQLNNSLGVGKFGLDVPQLEKAGMIKPGTAAAFLAEGSKDIVEVLKSPTVWTGKDGIKNLTGLLANENVQNKIQTNLMSAGLNAVKGAGIPIDSMTPQAVSGLANMAAKNVNDTVSFAKGLAANLPTPPGLPQIPGKDLLPTNVSTAFTNVAKNSSFAVNLSQQKIERPIKQEVPVEPAANTVDTETQAAAAQRVVGNEKVPTLSADGVSAQARAAVTAYGKFLKDSAAGAAELFKKVKTLTNQNSITQDEWNVANDELQLLRAAYNNRFREVQTAAKEAVASVPSGAEKNKLSKIYEDLLDAQLLFQDLVKELKLHIKDLASKIVK